MDLTGKKVLVTGADGFIGSHLVEALVKEGCKVRALVLYNSFNNWGWLEEIHNKENIEIVSGDTRDYNLCQKIVSNIDIVFHLAALIAIPYSYNAPQSYIDVNVKGTANIALACKEAGVKKLIHTSTSEVYGTAKYVPIDEKHPLQPQSPYSASKIAADAIAESFYNTYNLPLVIARPFNTYGPRQSARAVIPSVIIQILSGKKVLKLGDITTTRDFNFVYDTCQGFIKLASCDEAIGKTVNIGSNYEISIADVIKEIIHILNVQIDIITDEERIRPANSEVFRLWCDNSLIKKLTGFEPSYNIKKGLEKTIDWFSNPENLKKYKADLYNV